MAADMCVAVVKYSYASGVRADNTIPWTHIIASDVYLLLKGEDTHIQNGKLSMHVVQRNSVLVGNPRQILPVEGSPNVASSGNHSSRRSH